MKILSSQIELNGRQQNSVTTTQLERLSVAVLDQTSGSTTDSSGGKNITASVHLSITNSQQEQQSIETESTRSSVESGVVIEQHAGLQIAQYIVEQSSEMELSVAEVSQALAVNVGANSADINAAVNINGVEIASAGEVTVEVLSLLTQDSSESLTFEALGQVTTEDGHQIDFMLALDFQRSVHTEQVNQFVGNRDLIDPLMINLTGGAVEFTDLTFEFDLDSDGDLESIAQTASGSGFIVFDKNQNGEIDNGSEMFGPQSGQGFAELSQYDEDGNGWIDENDAIYAELGVMTFNGEGRTTQSLMEADVGAIFLGAVASDYDVNTESGMFAGKIKQSGAALAEDGRVLLMQEVHLADYTDGVNNSEGALEVITELDSDFQNPLDIESPLSLFQFTNPIIRERDAQTRVVISSQEELNAGVSFSIQLSAQPLAPKESENNHLAQQNFDRAKVALELSEWVAHAMADFEPKSSNSVQVEKTSFFTEVAQANPPVFDQAFTDMDLEEMKLESKLGTMRSMIESLRDMRLQMADSNNKMALYHRIDKFS